MRNITIAGRIVGDGCEPFCIAEVGLNHNGSVDLAKEMIFAAKRAGADAVKFQTFKAAGVCDEEQEYTYRSQNKLITEKRIEIFKRCELPDSAWKTLKAECDRVGILFMSTPQNPRDLDVLLEVGVPAIKIGSDDLTNDEMLRYCSRDSVGLPVILSCGMSNLRDVINATDILERQSVQYALLVCTSEYPCLSQHVNARRIQTLRMSYPSVPIGFSDHTMDELAACTAAALGSSIFECHFTLNHNMPGPDHWWSRTADDLADWVHAIHATRVMLGHGRVELMPGENREYQRTAPR